jgi:flagellar assembly factor FliW
MEITTSRFGNIKVAKEEIVTFPEGLLGFGSFKKFVILNTEGNSPFRWLQSLDDGDLAFIIIEPLNFMFSYEIDLADDEVAFLGLSKAEEVVIYAIVTIPENPKEMTANLQGPLVINAANRKARQIISGKSEHVLKARILDEMAKREAQVQNAGKKSKDSDKKGAKE